MPDVTTVYGDFSDLNTFFFLRIFIYYYLFEMLLLHQFFTDCVLRQKSKDGK